MSESIKIIPEINRTYKTEVNNLIKVLSIDIENDRLKIYNISESATMWISLSKHNLKTLIR